MSPQYIICLPFLSNTNCFVSSLYLLSPQSISCLLFVLITSLSCCFIILVASSVYQLSHHSFYYLFILLSLYSLVFSFYSLSAHLINYLLCSITPFYQFPSFHHNVSVTSLLSCCLIISVVSSFYQLSHHYIYCFFIVLSLNSNDCLPII